jgi:hypothetical protein
MKKEDGVLQASQTLQDQINKANLKGHSMGKVFSRGPSFVFCSKCNALLYWDGNRYTGTAELDCNGS